MQPWGRPCGDGGLGEDRAIMTGGGPIFERRLPQGTPASTPCRRATPVHNPRNPSDGVGWLLVVVVTVASADDGTSAPEVLARLTAEHRSRLELLWADSKYHNHRLEGWLVESAAGYRIEVVSRPPGSKGYVKLPRRWVVERTFAWLGRYRRNSRDYERSTGSSEAMIKVSSIHRMLRLLKPDLSKKPVPFKYRELQGNVTG